MQLCKRHKEVAGAIGAHVSSGLGNMRLLGLLLGICGQIESLKTGAFWINHGMNTIAEEVKVSFSKF